MHKDSLPAANKGLTRIAGSKGSTQFSFYGRSNKGRFIVRVGFHFVRERFHPQILLPGSPSQNPPCGDRPSVGRLRVSVAAQRTV